MSSFADVQALIIERHGIPSEGRRALLSRLRHLNSADFPPGTRVGKWTRAHYRIDDLFAFALWFALAEAFVPPTIAHRIIADLWPEFVRGMLTAVAADPRVGELPLGGSAARLAVLSPYALDFIGGGPRGSGRGSVGAGSWEFNPMDSLMTLPPARGALLVIDLGLEVSSIIGPVDSADPLEPALLEELMLVSAEQGWATADDVSLPATVTLASPRKRDPAGDRLGLCDYFFTRVIELLRSRTAAVSTAGWSPNERDRRHLDYIAAPFQREGWKRQLDFHGVPFLWAVWAALDNPGWVAPLPETLQMAIRGRFSGDGDDGLDALVNAASRARDMTPRGAYRDADLLH